MERVWLLSPSYTPVGKVAPRQPPERGRAPGRFLFARARRAPATSAKASATPNDGCTLHLPLPLDAPLPTNDEARALFRCSPAAVSCGPLSPSDLGRAVDIARADPEVQARLAPLQSGARLLIHVIPEEWWPVNLPVPLPVALVDLPPDEPLLGTQRVGDGAEVDVTDPSIPRPQPQSPARPPCRCERVEGGPHRTPS